ncbi:MAG: phospholipase [Proteobacteria bacterium ST_bin12]|nr:MAG: phospholipase [Proteobacteria bacterium ST_bin12]
MHQRKNVLHSVLRGAGLSVIGLLLQSNCLQANEVLTVEQAMYHCKTTYPSQFESKKRLACFDSISTPAIETVTENTAADIHASEKLTAEHLTEKIPAKVGAAAVKNPNADLSFLERKWRLTSEGDWDISDFETYKSNYLLVTNTNKVNNTPQSPSRLNTSDRNLHANDIKFQVSLKSELLNNIPLIRDLPYVTSSRLWGAYTQQSYWQIFNANASRPLRENNYEPELILSLGIDNEVNGVKKDYIPRMLNLGLVHQSNGRDNPLSRSWNRLYLEGGFELTDRISLLVRPWWRIPENDREDDNPDIEKFLGYGDMTVRWETESRKTAVSVLLRNNLRSDNKGFAQLSVQQRVFNNPYIKLHLMASTGYGETLLDYNHVQNVLGFGISLGE